MAEQRKWQMRISLTIFLLTLVLTVGCLIMAAKLHAQNKGEITTGAALAVANIQSRVSVNDERILELQNQVKEIKIQQEKNMNIIAQQGSEMYMIRGGVTTLTYLGGGISILVTMLSGISIAINLMTHQKARNIVQYNSGEHEAPRYEHGRME